MYQLTAAGLNKKNEMFDGREGIHSWAVLIFAELGLEDAREEMHGEPGFYDVTSTYVELDGVPGFFVSSYNDSNGYEGCEFQRIYKAEKKRGPLPKDQFILDGQRYYKP